VGDLRGIAHALDNLANATMDIDVDLRASQRMVEEALAIYRQLKARASMLNALYVYASILAWKGEYKPARAALREMSEIENQSGSQSGIILAKILLGGLDRLTGLEQDAEIMLEECLATVKARGSGFIQGWHYSRLLHELAYILVRGDETERARGLLQEALEICEMPEEQAQIQLCRGAADLRERDGKAALEDYGRSLEICKRSRFMLSAILALEGMAGALSLLLQPSLAVRLLAASSKFRRQVGAPISPWDRPVYESLQADLRRQLSAELFDETWSAGLRTAFDQAVEEALSLLP
jgi:tetratricopeptide (TPR) repeat protein